MVKQQKRLNELAELLYKSDATVVTQAIEMLREEEPFEGVISLLSDCYDKNTNSAVSKAIERFMNDMKEKSLQGELVNEIRKDHNPVTKGMLVASCWQSGIDYSEYCRDFTEVLLNSDYMVAIECLTVIEESSAHITNDHKSEMISMVENHQSNQSDEMKPLINELKSILSR